MNNTGQEFNEKTLKLQDRAILLFFCYLALYALSIAKVLSGPPAYGYESNDTLIWISLPVVLVLKGYGSYIGHEIYTRLYNPNRLISALIFLLCLVFTSIMLLVMGSIKRKKLEVES